MTMARIGLYILFLIAYTVWSVGLLLVTVKQVGAGSRRQRTHQFVLGQASVLVTVVGLTVFLYILSGVYSTWLLLVLLLGSEAAAIIGAGLRGLTGAGDATPKSSAISAALDFDVRYPVVAKAVTSILPMTIMVAYPVISGILFFWLPRATLPTRILQATLLFYLVLGAVGGIRTAITISSENLDEPARQTVLLNGAAELVPVMLLLSITFWAFGFGAEGDRILVGDTSLVVTPVVIGAVTVYFLVLALLPYVAGTQRGRRKKRLLLEERSSWYDRLHDTLLMPTPRRYEGKLEGFEAAIRNHRASFVNDNPILMLDARLRALDNEQDASQAATYDTAEPTGSIGMRRPTLPALPEALKSWTALLDLKGMGSGDTDELRRFAVARMSDARAVDPRFKHLQWFDALLQELEEARSSIHGQRALRDKEAMAASWARAYRIREAEIADRINEIQHTKAPVIVGASAVIGPLGTVVLDQFGSFAWETFSKTIAG
jgi:hypothetical protein